MQVKAVSWFVLSVALAVGTAAMAQDKTPANQQQTPGNAASGQRTQGRRPHSAADRLNRLDRRVGLTDAQKTKIKPILENEEQQMMAIRSDASLPRDQKITKMKALRQSTRSQVEQLLTSEQRAKFGPGRGYSRPNSQPAKPDNTPAPKS